MTKEAVAPWLVKQSDVPLTVVKPVATKLGVSTNYLGAALFAGQLVYENQETIVEYAGKSGLTAGEFLHQRAADRYGEDHRLTESLGENVEALDETLEGSEQEALTFAEFYRRIRERDPQLPTPEAGEALPDGPGRFWQSDGDGLLSSVRGAVTDAKPVSEAGPEAEDAVEIPVTDAE